MADRLLTPEQVAETLHLSPYTVKDWLRAGKLRGVKVGRSWRVRQQDLDEILRTGTPPKKDGEAQ